MRHPHTLRRSLLALAIALAASPMAAHPAAAAGTVKSIIFPVDGAVTYTDTFGACRDGCSRRHEGNDLMGKKMMKLVSAVDGVVHRVTFNNTSTGGNSVTIKAADGWTYHYLHVNNDTPGTDDGKATRAQAFPSNIVLGATVRRGQVVGYMGDSGNAESTGAHLHFEIRQPAAPGSYSGTAINPYPSLQAANPASAVGSKWYLRSVPSSGASTHAFAYGIRTDKALLCDWDADGLDEPVIYRDGTWYLRTGVTEAPTARRITFGSAGDTPLCGDLDGDGDDEPLLFKAGTWTARADFLTTSTTASLVTWGTTGDRPVLGDWDGDGTTDRGVVRGNVWYLEGEPGTTLYRFSYGASTDAPVAGDWDGDGIDQPAVFRDGTWHLRAGVGAGQPVLRSFTYGWVGDQPMAGAFAATTTSNIAVFRPGA